MLRAARRALHDEIIRRVARLENEPDASFSLTQDHAVMWDGAQVARVKPGPQALRPAVEALGGEYLDGAQRERIRRRLQRFVDHSIRNDLAPLVAGIDASETDPVLRGPLHLLGEALGLVPGVPGADMSRELNGRLKAVGARAGAYALFMPALLKPRAAAMRAWLWALQRRVPTPALPAPGLVSVSPDPAWPSGFAEAMGWIDAGPVLLRLDIAERVHAELAWAARRRPVGLPGGLASRLSIRADLLPVVLRRLGFRVVPAAALDPAQFGPPAPSMLVPLRRRRAAEPVPGPSIPRPTGPFAALADLRR